MEEKTIKVTIRSPSRLHFGIIDMRGDLGRIHGSVGVAIDKPHLLLEAEKDSQLNAFGIRSDRIKEYARIFIQDQEIEAGVKFKLISDIPEHMGYGSGTQLALAVGVAISELYDINLSPNKIAAIMKRSKRSGIGAYAFQYGGFIIDGGNKLKSQHKVPPLTFRSNVPKDWLFVIGLPQINSSKSEDSEKKAFDEIQPPPKELVWEVSYIILMQMIPSIQEKDIESFGKSITSLDYKFGGYWMDVQGGRYSHSVIEKGVNFLLDQGAYGAGQSSWGPVFYGLVKGVEQASVLTKELSTFFDDNGIEGEVYFTKPNNQGAQIRLS